MKIGGRIGKNSNWGKWNVAFENTKRNAKTNKFCGHISRYLWIEYMNLFAIMPCTSLICIVSLSITTTTCHPLDYRAFYAGISWNLLCNCLIANGNVMYLLRECRCLPIRWCTWNTLPGSCFFLYLKFPFAILFLPFYENKSPHKFTKIDTDEKHWNKKKQN